MAEPREHPKAQDTIDLEKSVRRTRALIEKNARDIYKDLTGHKLPELLTFQEPDGTRWKLNVYIQLQLVEKGQGDGE